MKAKFHMNAKIWDPFGGEISCISMAFTNALRGALLGIVPWYPSRMIYGLTQFFSTVS
jgi:hypothetical protein